VGRRGYLQFAPDVIRRFVPLVLELVTYNFLPINTYKIEDCCGHKTGALKTDLFTTSGAS